MSSKHEVPKTEAAVPIALTYGHLYGHLQTGSVAKLGQFPRYFHFADLSYFRFSTKRNRALI